MARFSEKSIHTMSRLLDGKDAKGHMSGAAKRRFNEAIGPLRACYDQVTAPNKDPALPDIQWAFANVKTLLRVMAMHCPTFVAFLQQQAQPLRCILSHDECTAGNVLATEQRQKITLCYFSMECMARWGDSPIAWLPISAISHAQVTNTRGGMGRIHRSLVEAWSSQRLEEPFQLTETLSIRLELATFVADHEAQRGALCAKGSAGLKPCAFCVNCIAKGAEATSERDAQFRTIAECDMAAFQQHSTESLRRMISQSLLQPHRKAEHELLERVLGYRIAADNMWTSPACLQMLPLERCCNDSMHAYFANGICSVEIALLIDAVQRVTGKSIADIRQCVVDAGWQRHRMHVRHGENQYWTKRLFTEAYFGTAMYKGSAKQTLALLSLLRWICESVWLRVAGLEAAATCFLKLCIFAANFQQWLTENMGGSEFSTRLLPRLALRHMEMWNDRPLAAAGYTLEQRFSEEEVQKETNLSGVALAAKCRIGMLELHQGDLLLWGPASEEAGICHFFLEKEAELYVYLSCYKFTNGTASLRTFRITNDKVMVRWNALENPKTCSWWRNDKSNSHVHCLP
eukprot:s230_g21.t1